MGDNVLLKTFEQIMIFRGGKCLLMLVYKCENELSINRNHVVVVYGCRMNVESLLIMSTILIFIAHGNY